MEHASASKKRNRSVADIDTDTNTDIGSPTTKRKKVDSAHSAPKPTKTKPTNKSIETTKAKSSTKVETKAKAKTKTKAKTPTKVKSKPPKPPAAVEARAGKRVVVVQDDVKRYSVYLDPADLVSADLARRLLAEFKRVPVDARDKATILKDGSSKLREWSPFVNRQFQVLSNRRMFTVGDMTQPFCLGYSFSGQTSVMHDWTTLPALMELKTLLEATHALPAGYVLGMCHANLYPPEAGDGKVTRAGISRHQDDEDDLLADGDILCVSLGASVMFEFSRGVDRRANPPVARLWSRHGQVYVMRGTCQSHLFHGTAPPSGKTREARLVDGAMEYGRISLTFRCLRRQS
jgi:alkylated DNA repair dioxygenase AlkB